jgi:hypothetical protein
MNVNELYEAIGQADPDLVEHSERTVRRSGRKAVRIALSAAVLLVVMSITVAASPALQQLLGLRVAQTGEAGFVLGPHISFAKTAKLQLLPELANTEQAPKTIETRYVPMELAEHWEPEVLEVQQGDGTEASIYERLLKDTETELLFYRDRQRESVLFRQYAVGGRTAEDLDLSVSLGFGSDYSIETLQFGALSVQLVTVPPSEITRSELDPNGQRINSYASSNGGQYCYWTDGSYLYSLETKLDLPRETLRDIVTSLAPVEDVTVYMPLHYVEPEPTQSYPLPDRVYRPAYLPDGFVLASFEPGFEKTLTQVFTNEALGCSILLEQRNKPYFSSEQIFVGKTQDVETSEVQLGDKTVTVEYAEAEGFLYMQWNEDSYRFELTSFSNISPEFLPELYRMIESMTPDE